MRDLNWEKLGSPFIEPVLANGGHGILTLRHMLHELQEGSLRSALDNVCAVERARRSSLLDASCSRERTNPRSGATPELPRGRRRPCTTPDDGARARDLRGPSAGYRAALVDYRILVH